MEISSSAHGFTGGGENTWLSYFKHEMEIGHSSDEVCSFYVLADGYGATIHFDEKGDAPGRYTIMNYQRNRQSREYEYKVVGKWADGLLDLDLRKLVWSGGTMDIPRSCVLYSFYC